MKKSKSQLSSIKSTTLVSSQVIENFFKILDPDGNFELRSEKIVKPRMHTQGKDLNIQQELDLFPR